MQFPGQQLILAVVIGTLVDIRDSNAFVVGTSPSIKSDSGFRSNLKSLRLFDSNHNNQKIRNSPQAATPTGFSWQNIKNNSTTTTSIAALVDDTVDYERTRKQERQQGNKKPSPSYHTHYDPSYWTGSTLGDIMSSSSMTSPAAADAIPEQTSPTTTSLFSLYNISNPLDRLVLTANGNVQRLVSSYYDAEVSVIVDSCQPRLRIDTRSQESSDDDPETTNVWDRVVHLTVFGLTFCTATSVITVRDRHCQELVESGKIGLGQLFRYLDILPHFQLIRAAPKPEGGFWRIYTLSCPELTCYIHEDFCKDMWNMKLALE